MYKVKLRFINEFKWAQRNDLFFAGYFYDNKNKYYAGENALNFIEKTDSVDKLKSLLDIVNGIFTIGIKIKDSYVFCCSRIKYFPLYYQKTESGWLISDSCYEITGNNSKYELLDISCIEFLKQGYVGANRTLYKNVYSLRSGEILILEQDSIRNEIYYNHTLESFPRQDFDSLKEKLENVIHNIGSRLAEALNNRKVLLPLSGGYDSRLIACILKNAGIKDVICFSYGKKNNKEVAVRKDVAKKLGYKWYFVDYLIDYKPEDIFKSKEFISYAHFAANGVSMPYLQEYIAVKYLLENNIADQDCVVLPGHSGGFLAGSFLGHHICNNEETNITDTLYRFNVKFSPAKKAERINIYEYLKKQINSYKEELNLKNPIPYTVLEGIIKQEWETKFILNSSKVFEFFRIQSMFPFWDYELEDFFKLTPYEYRLNKKLFKKVLEEKFFLPQGVVYDEEFQPGQVDYVLQRLKKPFKKYIPQSIRNSLLKKNDWMCYDEFTSILQDELSAMGVKKLKHYYQYNAIICYWYLNVLKKQG